MDIDSKKVIESMIIPESIVYSKKEQSHVENYKNLVTFIENAIVASVAEGKSDYQKLLTSCLNLIKNLNVVISSYENAVKNTVEKNKIVTDILDLLAEEQKTVEPEQSNKEKEQRYVSGGRVLRNTGERPVNHLRNRGKQ